MDFGELRSVAQRPANPATWRDLCCALDGFHAEPLTHEILPYVDGVLRAWPDRLRAAPERWVQRALAGERPPELALARTLALDLDPGGPVGQLVQRDGVAALTEDPALLGITKLALAGVVSEHEQDITKLRRAMPVAKTLALRTLRSDRLLPLASWRRANVFAGLDHLDLSPLERVGPRELLRFLAAPKWGLKSLDVSYGMRYPRAEQLAAATMLPELTAWVGVGVGRTSDPLALRTLRTAGWFARLRRFGASTHNAVDARAFATSAHITRLEALELQGPGILDSFIERLAERDDLSLRHLAVHSNELGPKAFGAMASSALLPELEHLALSASFRLERVGRLVTMLGRAERLKAFGLHGVALDPDGLQRVLSGPWMERLESLELSGFDIGKTGLEVVVAAMGVKSVESLSLRGCRLNDFNARALMVPNAMPWVRVLDVRDNPRLTKVKELARVLGHAVVRA